MKYFAFFFFLFLGCNTSTYFDGPNSFEDNFDNYSSFSDTLEPDRWSHVQRTRDENSVSLDDTFFHSPPQSLKFFAARTTDGDSSKSSIVKQEMAFWAGETIKLSAWYYIQGEAPLDWLFLLDLEERTSIGAGPGLRLALVNNQLRVEYKFDEKDLLQNEKSEVDFPRDEWVEIVWEIELSTAHDADLRLYQNGVLLINAKNKRTLPQDLLYFQQGTKGMFSSVEFGITSNSASNHLTLWVDDIFVETID